MSEKRVYLIGHREVEHPIKTHGLPRMTPHESIIDYHKIGVAKDPSARVGQLSCGTPHKLELVTTIESDEAKEVEKLLHNINSMGKKTGEWYLLGDDMLNSLKEVEYLARENVERVAEKRRVEQTLPDESFRTQIMEVRSNE